jgi:hypothetical protein
MPLITTVTLAPPGLNTRCTCIFPGPSTVTLTVSVAPTASVPDIGETMTFLARPGDSETDQATGPPEAASRIVPGAGGTTTSVAGLTLSVPETGVPLTAADADVEARTCAGAALAGVPLPPGATPALAVARFPLAVGLTPVTPTDLPAGGRGPWWGGAATMMTADATAAVVPASAAT